MILLSSPSLPLITGSGESGKSTLVKQMKIIHGDGYTLEELKAFRPTICDNLVHSMRAVLEVRDEAAKHYGCWFQPSVDRCLKNKGGRFVQSRR